jgi:cupin 2 domain-containing protein
MKNIVQNIFTDLAQTFQDEEVFTELLNNQSVKIERVVSTGQITPVENAYDQIHDEWVILLAGSAKMWLEHKGDIELNYGDYLFIPAGQKHRVTFTSNLPPAVWLAIHIL